MAAPWKRPQSRTITKPSTPGRFAGRKSAKTPRRAERVQRVFVVLVVPVLLMLGSVYAHTVAAGLKVEVARLEEEKVRAESEGERLEVWIAGLSEPGKVRDLAKEKLGMRDPGKDLEMYGSDGEAYGGEEKREGVGE